MEIFHFRIKFVVAIMLIFLSLVVLRLIELQALKGEKLYNISTTRPIARSRIEAPRGKILDRYGKVLAESRPYFVLQVMPAQIKNKKQCLKTLAFLLDLSEDKIESEWRAQKLKFPQDPIIIAEKLNRDEVAKIQGKISQVLTASNSKDFDLNGISFEIAYERIYPYGQLGGHLLGYLKKPNVEQWANWEEKDPGRLGPHAQIGIVGIEKKFDDILRGYDGFDFAFVDAQGREVSAEDLGVTLDFEDIPVQPGRDITLHLDIELMQIAARALSGRAGAVAALNPQTGEVLALLSQPSYDPKELSGSLSPETWSRLQNHPHSILVHRAIQAAYPPGSTYKIITALAGLADHKINPQEKINCPGYYQHGNRRWGCWNRSGHGTVNLHQALKQSCDVYFYKLGERVTGERLAYYARLLGLGKKTGVLDLQEERAGLVPDASWKQKHRHQEWKVTDDLLTAIGQGANLVTPLQSALMLAQFVNGGNEVSPKLMRSSQDQAGKISLTPLSPLKKIALGLTSEQYFRIYEALIAVVEAEDGTGKRARLKEIKVGGKTGTAQVVSLERKGKVAGKSEDHAWFVAFAPTEKPEIVLAVLVEHGGGGGAVAAPIAQAVLQAYFKKQKILAEK